MKIIESISKFLTDGEKWLKVKSARNWRLLLGSSSLLFVLGISTATTLPEVNRGLDW